MDFWGLVWKRAWKITFFGVKSGKDLRNCAAHPHQEFPGVPPSPGNCLLLTLIRPPKRPSAFFDAHCFQFLSSAATFPACSYTTWSRWSCHFSFTLSTVSTIPAGNPLCPFRPGLPGDPCRLASTYWCQFCAKNIYLLRSNKSQTAYKLIISTRNSWHYSCSRSV